MPHKAYFNLPEEKRERIKHAAMELFASLPYEEVTTRMLVQKAGISMGSLYQYFQSKDDMYIYYIDEVYHDWMKHYELNLWRRESLEHLPLERSFVDSMYNAPPEVLEKIYFSRENQFSVLNEQIYTRRKQEGSLPDYVEPGLLSFLEGGVRFAVLMYARALGVTGPEENDRFAEEHAQTVRYFGRELETGFLNDRQD